MQVGIDVTCMQTNFGGCGLFGFGDTATFKNGQISLSDHGLYIVHGHQKIQLIGIGSKNSCKYGLMSHACTPILVGVVSLVSEILLTLKTAKFPFLTMDYIVHGHQKIQSIGIGTKNSCKYGLMSHACKPILVGVVSSVLEILLALKMAKFPFLTMDYNSPSSSKNSIYRNWLKKFMQVWIDVTCMQTNFGGCGLFGFGDTATFKNGQISLSDHGL